MKEIFGCMVGCITCSPGQCFQVFQCVAAVAEEGKTIQPNLYGRRPCSLACSIAVKCECANLFVWLTNFHECYYLQDAFSHQIF
jgi:hypothetical protein